MQGQSVTSGELGRQEWSVNRLELGAETLRTSRATPGTASSGMQRRVACSTLLKVTEPTRARPKLSTRGSPRRSCRRSRCLTLHRGFAEARPHLRTDFSALCYRRGRLSRSDRRPRLGHRHVPIPTRPVGMCCGHLHPGLLGRSGDWPRDEARGVRGMEGCGSRRQETPCPLRSGWPRPVHLE